MPIQRMFSDTIYMSFYDHYCPICSSRMEKIKCSGYVDSWSAEAINFDLSSGDTRMCGTVKLIWDELRCPICKYQITSKEMIKYERKKNVNGQRIKKCLSSINLIFIYFRKHKCPICRSKLVLDDEHIDKNESDESNNTDMSDTRFVRNVILERKIFKCYECGFRNSILEMFAYEQNQRQE